SPRTIAALEQLCRYVLRPPIAQERFSRTADGRILLTLKAEWTDGTTALVFEPVELLERLAALTPRPRINLDVGEPAPTTDAASPRPRAWSWPDLLRHTFAVDVLACPRCGGRMRVIATIEDPVVIRKILTHLGLPTEPPSPRPPPRNLLLDV